MNKYIFFNVYFYAIELYKYLRVACFSLSCKVLRVSKNRSINSLLFYFINKICDKVHVLHTNILMGTDSAWLLFLGQIMSVIHKYLTHTRGKAANEKEGSRPLRVSSQIIGF